MPHIGHAKTYVSFDVVVRYLRFSGYRVRYVQNITDVGHILDTGEDRILKGSRRERIEPMEVVERYTHAYFAAMDALGVTRPDISPRASAHVPEQIEMIKQLIADGFAYEVDGSVYFAVEKFAGYGRLSGRHVEELEEGARITVRDEKRHPADFALWKKAEPEHILRWPSPWGWGYPGWHIECSGEHAQARYASIEDPLVFGSRATDETYLLLSKIALTSLASMLMSWSVAVNRNSVTFWDYRIGATRRFMKWIATELQGGVTTPHRYGMTHNVPFSYIGHMERLREMRPSHDSQTVRAFPTRYMTGQYLRNRNSGNYVATSTLYCTPETPRRVNNKGHVHLQRALYGEHWNGPLLGNAFGLAPVRFYPR